MTEEQMAFEWGGDRQADSVEGPPARGKALAKQLSRLAERGVYLGTSSWKYPGWLDQIYSRAKYATRGRFSEKRFNKTCLAEYAQVFPTVCGDFAFYQFPTDHAWEEIFSQLPGRYRFSLKVPEDLTVERFPDLPRYGQRAGRENAHFMDAGLVGDRLLARLEPYRDQLGVIIFEFGTIHREPISRPEEFAAGLDHMFSRLPCDRFRFAVEVRNPDFVMGADDYLSCLRSHGVAHCFNSWTRMPPVSEQLDQPGTLTAKHVAARFLLRPGRGYQQAVNQFAPYERIQDPYPEGRSALQRLIETCLPDDERILFAFVNNRFEGSAVETIEQTVASMG